MQAAGVCLSPQILAPAVVSSGPGTTPAFLTNSSEDGHAACSQAAAAFLADSAVDKNAACSQAAAVCSWAAAASVAPQSLRRSHVPDGRRRRGGVSMTAVHQIMYPDAAGET
jgi:hypothetical protein